MIFTKSNSLLTIVALLLFSFQALAQFPYTKLFYPLGENESHAIGVLYQDGRGLIWMGTSNGLRYFDGFETHGLEKTDSLQNALVATAFAESHDGKLWVGFDNGQLGFVSNYELILLNPDEGMPKQAIASIAFDTQQRVWFATLGEGIYIYDYKRLYNINHDDGLPDDNVHALLHRNNKMWAGTERGLVELTFDHGSKKLKSYSKREGLPDEVIMSLGVDHQNKMWLGLLDNGMAYFDESTVTFHSPKAFQGWDKGRVRRMQWSDSRSWLVTDYQGIWVFDAARDTVFAQPFEGLPAARYSDALLDGEGLIWLCASNRLYKTSGELLQRFPVLNSTAENVQAVLCRRNGDVWYATNQGLFELHDGNVFATPRKPDALTNVVTMYEDENENIWIGTFGGGLWQFNSSTKSFKHYTESEGLPDNSILFVTGTNNAIWLATLGGVSRMTLNNDVPQFENFTEANGLQSAYVYNIFVDRLGRTWLGTDGRGVNLWDGARFTNPVTKGTLNTQVVYSIVEDATGNIWVATARNGLYRLQKDSAINYGTEQGLDDYNITGLATDSTGNVFIVHNDGLECLNTHTGQFTFYGRLMNAADLQTGLNAVCIANRRTFWAGAKEGLLRFTPPDARLRVAPLIHLRTVNVLTDAAPALSDSTFTYNQNFLRFRYEAVWNVDPDALTFQYKLGGAAKTDWINTRDRDVVLPRLGSGKYQLDMRAGLVGAYNSAHVLTHRFVVEPAWWQRWWFYALVILALTGIVILLVRSRERTLQQQQQMVQLRLKAEYETLRNQVNPHFLFNSFNTLVAAIEDDPPTAVEYVQHMSDFFRRMLEVREKPLVSLTDELELTTHYLFLQQKRYGSNFSVQNDINVNTDQFALPPLTLQLLLENAFKHNAVSRSTPLKIRLAVENDALVVSNSLNPKPYRESGTGIGLENIRSRVRLLGRGEVLCEQTDVTFTVHVPLVENIAA